VRVRLPFLLRSCARRAHQRLFVDEVDRIHSGRVVLGDSFCGDFHYLGSVDLCFEGIDFCFEFFDGVDQYGDKCLALILQFVWLLVVNNYGVISFKGKNVLGQETISPVTNWGFIFSVSFPAIGNRIKLLNKSQIRAGHQIHMLVLSLASEVTVKATLT
jgi:hypothetical protein